MNVKHVCYLRRIVIHRERTKSRLRPALSGHQCFCSENNDAVKPVGIPGAKQKGCLFK